MFVPKTWCTKKHFDYRIAHYGYLLTSCPGHKNPTNIKTLIFFVDWQKTFVKSLSCKCQL